MTKRFLSLCALCTVLFLMAFASLTPGCQSSNPQSENAQESTSDAGNGLPANSPCDPKLNQCQSGLLCCATCCGTPPPDGGQHDPNYRCIQPLASEPTLCPAIP